MENRYYQNFNILATLNSFGEMGPGSCLGFSATEYHFWGKITGFSKSNWFIGQDPVDYYLLFYDNSNM